MLRSWRSSQIFATQPVRAYGSEPPGREHAMLKNDLLASKLHVPHLRARLVPRPQGVELLEQGIRRALTLISPPAGSGKTTILRSWLRDAEVLPPWLSLDRHDNRLHRLSTHLPPPL